MIKCDIAVIGAGVGGLTAAYSLSKKNINTIIIEKENYVGGRASSEKYKGYTLDRGAVYIMLFGKTLRNIFSELNIPDSELMLVKKKISYFYDGKFHTLDFSNFNKLLISFLKFKLIPHRKKIEIHTLKFFKKCLDEFNSVTKEYKNWKYTNDQSAAELLNKYFNETIITDVFKPTAQTFLLTDLKNVSEKMILVLFGSFLSQKNKIFHLKKGIGQLANSLYKKYIENGGKFRNANVISIRKKNNYFEIITSKKEKILAKAIISNIPVNDFGKIFKNNSKESAEAWSKVEYVSNICLNIGLKEPLKNIKDDHLVFLKSKKNNPIISLGELTSKNTHVAPSKKGLLYVLCSPEFSKKNISTNPKKIYKIISSEVSKLFPDFRDKFIFYRIFKWKKALIKADQNYFKTSTVHTPINGIFICGDSVYIGLDGVAKSGEFAAEAAEYYISKYFP